MTYPNEIREIINDYLIDNYLPNMNKCNKDIKSAFLFLKIICRQNHYNIPTKMKVYSGRMYSACPKGYNKGIMCTICQEKVALDNYDIIRVL